MPRRVDVDEGGDPSGRRAALRVAARGLQVLGGGLILIAWALERGKFEILSGWQDAALGGVGLAMLAVGSWLAGGALRTMAPQRDD